ncbi:MAG: hypothetical protein U0271_32245 [Polyangiaceae bacterium]
MSVRAFGQRGVALLVATLLACDADAPAAPAPSGSTTATASAALGPTSPVSAPPAQPLLSGTTRPPVESASAARSAATLPANVEVLPHTFSSPGALFATRDYLYIVEATREATSRVRRVPLADLGKLELAFEAPTLRRLHWVAPTSSSPAGSPKKQASASAPLAPTSSAGYLVAATRDHEILAFDADSAVPRTITPGLDVVPRDSEHLLVLRRTDAGLVLVELELGSAKETEIAVLEGRYATDSGSLVVTTNDAYWLAFADEAAVGATRSVSEPELAHASLDLKKARKNLKPKETPKAESLGVVRLSDQLASTPNAVFAAALGRVYRFDERAKALVAITDVGATGLATRGEALFFTNFDRELLAVWRPREASSPAAPTAPSVSASASAAASATPVSEPIGDTEVLLSQPGAAGITIAGDRLFWSNVSTGRVFSMPLDPKR